MPGLFRRACTGLLAAGLAGACTARDNQTARDATAAGTSLDSTAPRVAAAPVQPGDWITYNGSLSGERYSPLTQITPANVAQLKEVCAFDAPDTVSLQSGIVAVGGTLYFTAFNNTYAVDGTTCQQKWKQTRAEPSTYLKVSRGVGYSDGRLFRGTGDAHVLGLDAATGRQLWDVSIGDPKIGESVPMSPIASNGLVYVGNAGGDNFDVRGRIYALDAATGRVVWEFHTIPDSGAVRATWGKASAENPPAGAATWTSYALDDARGILYVGTGNPAPDFVEAFHPGLNLYANAVLALDAKTGRLLAYVQPVRNDFHDWDVSAPPALITTAGGRSLVAQAAKDGHVYGIERSAVAPEAVTPDTAALAIRYKALVATRENAETPLTSDRETRFCPGTQGGVEWNGPTYDQKHGYLVVNAIDWCTSVKLQRLDTLKGAPGQSWSGMDDPKMAFGRQDPISKWRGWITAVDAENGAIRWRVRTPKPMVAGITSTAGGVVFTGDLDGNVLALDAGTGKELWRNPTSKAIGGGVISYEAGGKQYVAAAAGLNSAIWPVHGGTARIVVYALP
jgi:alcohol dehydrogenase (cytochrome c)